MNSKIICMLFLFTLSLVSCSLFIGTKSLQTSPSKISAIAMNYGVNETDSYLLDTSYISYISSLTKATPKQLNDHLQPLQAIYYSKKDGFNTPVAWYINCYAGGFPNLQWNRNGMMDIFPPQMQAPIDSLISLNQHNTHIRSASGRTSTFNYSGYDYVVLVYWSCFMGRQSKRLIQQITENVKKSTEKIKVVYLNTDFIFSVLGK